MSNALTKRSGFRKKKIISWWTLANNRRDILQHVATCCILSVGLICHWKIRSTCLYLLVGIQTCKLDQLWWLSMSFNFVGALQKVSVIIHQHEQFLISCFHQNIHLIFYHLCAPTSAIAYQLFVLVISHWS